MKRKAGEGGGGLFYLPPPLRRDPTRCCQICIIERRNAASVSFGAVKRDYQPPLPNQRVDISVLKLLERVRKTLKIEEVSHTLLLFAVVMSY